MDVPPLPDSPSEMPYRVKSRLQLAFPAPTTLCRRSPCTTQITPLKKNRSGGAPGKPSKPQAWSDTLLKGQSPLVQGRTSGMQFYRVYNSGPPGPRDHLTFTWVVPAGLRAALQVASSGLPSLWLLCPPARRAVGDPSAWPALGSPISFSKHLSEFPLITGLPRVWVVQECYVQNTARYYAKIYAAEAQPLEGFGEVPE